MYISEAMHVPDDGSGPARWRWRCPDARDKRAPAGVDVDVDVGVDVRVDAGTDGVRT